MPRVPLTTAERVCLQRAILYGQPWPKGRYRFNVLRDRMLKRMRARRWLTSRDRITKRGIQALNADNERRRREFERSR